MNKCAQITGNVAKFEKKSLKRILNYRANNVENSDNKNLIKYYFYLFILQEI